MAEDKIQQQHTKNASNNNNDVNFDYETQTTFATQPIHREDETMQYHKYESRALSFYLRPIWRWNVRAYRHNVEQKQQQQTLNGDDDDDDGYDFARKKPKPEKTGDR